MKNKILYASLGFLALNYANAQNTPEQNTDTLLNKLINLKEVVFSANKAEEEKKDIPYTIDIIKSKDVELNNSQTSADMIANTGNIMVQKSQGGGGSPIIRGFEASRVLMVIDGIRMNNAVYRAGHLQDIITIDNAMLERTEIIYGPSSVMYGSDALGGVMHFYTKNPLFGPEKMNFKLNAYARYSSANEEKTEHVDFNLGFKKIASLTSITHSNFGDLRTGNGRNPNPDFGLCKYYAGRNSDNTADSMIKNNNPNIQKFSGYNQTDIMEKILYRANENVKVGLNIQYSTSSNINRYDRLSEYSGTKLKYAEWYYGPQNRLMASLFTEIKSNNKVFDRVRIAGSYQDIDQSRISRRFNKNNKNYQIENVKVSSLNADFRKQVKEKHELSYGIEILNNNVSSTAKSIDISTNEETPSITRYPDGGSTMMTAAAYFTHSWEISKKVILSDGIRYSHNTLTAKFVDTTFYPFPFKNTTQKNGALNGNLGIVINPEDNVRFNLLASTGYRSPNVDDLTKIFESTGGIIIIPNEKLRPEYAYNFEGGFNLLSNNAKISFEANYFYTILQNAIVTKNTSYQGNDSIMYAGTLSQVQSQQNVDNATIQGAFGSIKAEISDNIAFKSSLTYTHGNYFDKVNDTIVPLDHIPPMFGQTSLLFHYKKFEGELYSRYSAAKKLKDYSPSGEDNLSQATPNGMPGWITLNFKTSFKISKTLTANFGIENLFDTHYRVFASGISSPGRNIVASLRVKL